MFSEFDKWPLLLQILAGLGAVGMGALMYFRTKKEPSPIITPWEKAIKEIRDDLGLAVKSLQTSVNDQIQDFEERVGGRISALNDRMHEIKTDVAVLYDRHERNPEQKGPRR